MTRSVGTLYLVLAMITAGLAVVASIVLRDWWFLIAGVGTAFSGLVVTAVLSGLADIADELRQLRSDVRGQQGRARPDMGQVGASRDSAPLWAAANRSANSSPLFKDDGGEPEPVDFSPVRSPQNRF